MFKAKQPTNKRLFGIDAKNWAILSACAENKTPLQTPVYIAISAQPLEYKSEKFGKATKSKIDAELALIRNFYPQAPIHILFGDKLFLDSYQLMDSMKAAKDVKSRRQEWQTLLGLPISSLSSATPSIPCEYKNTEGTDQNPLPPSLVVELESWAKDSTPEEKSFLNEFSKGLIHIMKQPNPETILLDDEKLYSREYLGFVKHTVEQLITEGIGYTEKSGALFQNFMKRFAHSAIFFLKHLQNIPLGLENNLNSNNHHLTRSKLGIYEMLNPQTRLQLFCVSLYYQIAEFYRFTHLLVIRPKQRGLANSSPRVVYYASGQVNTSSNNALYGLNDLCKKVGLAVAFLACAEYQPQIMNNDPCSSNGEQNMTKNQSKPADIPPKQGEAQVQVHNGSPSNSNGSATSEKSSERELHDQDSSETNSSISPSPHGSDDDDDDRDLVTMATLALLKKGNLEDADNLNAVRGLAKMYNRLEMKKTTQSSTGKTLSFNNPSGGKTNTTVAANTSNHNGSSESAQNKNNVAPGTKVSFNG